MSRFTTEVRYICENYAGFDESVGLSKIDEVLDSAVPKVFDFDYPIFEEVYRRPLERKILSHYYTREIGYETVGRWKLALRNKMNEIMPYYNQLYKAAGQFGRLNLFEDVNLTDSKSGNAERVGSRTLESVGDMSDVMSESGTENENTNDSRSKIVNSKGVESNTDSRTITGNDSGSVGTAYSSHEGRNKNESINKKDNETRDINKSRDGSVNEDVTDRENNSRSYSENDKAEHGIVGVKSNSGNSESWRNITGNEEGTYNGSKHEQLDGRATGRTLTETENDSVKRRLFSDTPQGAIDFSYEGGSGTGGTGGDGDGAMDVSSTYITNLTKDIGKDVGETKVESLNDTESSTNTSQVDKTNTSTSNTESGKNSSSVNETNKQDETNASERIGSDVVNREGNKATNTVTSDTETVGEEYSSNSSHSGSIIEVGDKTSDETVTKENNRTENTESNGSKNNEVNGSEIANNNIRRDINRTGDKNRTVNNTDTENENNNVKTTESFVNLIRGKRGNATYSAMFSEFKQALVNIDMMVIEELSTLFMGLWE